MQAVDGRHCLTVRNFLYSISAYVFVKADHASNSKVCDNFALTLLLLDAADGNEGGRHHLITAAVGNGNLYVMKVQIGDKRWFKGARKDAEGAWNSFTVA